MNAICKYMRGCGGINAFILVRNGTNIRFDGAFQFMLREYHNVFGEEFFNRLTIVPSRIEGFAKEQYVMDGRESELKDDICTFLKGDDEETEQKEGKEESKEEGSEKRIPPLIPIGFDSFKESISTLVECVSVLDKQHFEEIQSPIDDLRAEYVKLEKELWDIDREIDRIEVQINPSNEEGD